MDNFRLKRGGSHIRLQKSGRLIGMRPATEGREHGTWHKDADLTLLPTGQFLAGFEILKAPEQDAAETVLDRLRGLNPGHTGSQIYVTPKSGAAYAPTGKVVVRP